MQYDFIYAVNGERVRSTRELTAALDRHQVGETVQLTVLRYDSVRFLSNGSRGYGRPQAGDDSEEMTVGGCYRCETIGVPLELPESTKAQ